ncbi:MAG: transposase [Planctomycetota bacterium]
MIESVTIDMSKAFIKAVQEMVPNAKLIFDRFHMRRLVQDALDETRRDEVRMAKGKDEKDALKHTSFALLKSSFNLTEADNQTLDKIAKSNEGLFRGLLLKDLFAAALDGKQINVARANLERWIFDARDSGLVHFVRVAGTIEKYLDGILG